MQQYLVTRFNNSTECLHKAIEDWLNDKYVKGYELFYMYEGKTYTFVIVKAIAYV